MFIINLCLSDFISPLLTYHMFVYSSYKGIWQFSYDSESKNNSTILLITGVFGGGGEGVNPQP